MQECVSRASDLLGADLESITAKPLEQFPEEGGSMADGALAEQEEYKSVLTQYYGFASIFASISVVLVAMAVWIMLQ